MGWTKGDDAKLADLFRKGPRNGGLYLKNLSKNYIQTEIIAKHWKRKSTIGHLMRSTTKIQNLQIRWQAKTIWKEENYQGSILLIKSFLFYQLLLKGKQIQKYDHKGEARVFQSPKGRGRRRAKNDEDDDDAMQAGEIRSASRR